MPFIGVKDGNRLARYPLAKKQKNRVYKVPLSGITELRGIRRGQLWEVERHKGKPWKLYTVTSISYRPVGFEHMVYMHSVKSGRLIVKSISCLQKGKGCRMVKDSEPSSTTESSKTDQAEI